MICCWIVRRRSGVHSSSSPDADLANRVVQLLRSMSVRRVTVAKIVGAAGVLAAGMALQGCLGGIANINPCGTVLNCNPDTYAQMFGDYWEPDYEVDPTCTIPFGGSGALDGNCPDLTGGGGA
jgi:hypothetical protein